jgi:hypothetical protein
MASPIGIVNGLWRKLAASPRFRHESAPVAACKRRGALTAAYLVLAKSSRDARLKRDPPLDLRADLC